MALDDIQWHEMADTALFTNILVQDARRWVTPNLVDENCSHKVVIYHMFAMLKIVERRARDFHAALWSQAFEEDLGKLGLPRLEHYT